MSIHPAEKSRKGQQEYQLSGLNELASCRPPFGTEFLVDVAEPSESTETGLPLIRPTSHDAFADPSDNWRPIPVTLSPPTCSRPAKQNSPTFMILSEKLNEVVKRVHARRSLGAVSTGSIVSNTSLREKIVDRACQSGLGVTNPIVQTVGRGKGFVAKLRRRIS